MAAQRSSRTSHRFATRRDGSSLVRAKVAYANNVGTLSEGELTCLHRRICASSEELSMYT